MNEDKSPPRVFRGGSWYNSPAYARVADRLRSTPGYRYYILGVRLSRIITPMQQVAEVTNAK